MSIELIGLISYLLYAIIIVIYFFLFMKETSDTLQPKDIVALVIILGLIIFKLTGHNGTFDVPVGVIVGYYFAKRKNGVDTGR